WFMSKEINEEPEALADTLRGRTRDGLVVLSDLGERLSDDVLAGITRIVLVAAGTASYAAQVGRYAIESWARVPVDVELSHEFHYREPLLDGRTLVISISQSGETMDTLLAVQHARAHGAL